jgi:tRNA-splicing ligase RtcB (3'-phosphate/5'-hydroxy nucleic acid ligase)
MFTITGKYTSALITIDDIDASTIQQLYLMASHPSCTNPIVIMPDCHAGKGCCIGFTMKVSDKVVPNFVGMDTGCGVFSRKTYLSESDFTPNKLKILDIEFRKNIPTGMNVNQQFNKNIKNRYIKLLNAQASKVNNLYTNHLKHIDVEGVEQIVKSYGVDLSYFYASAGTIGGGNHFAEFGTSSNDGKVWATVHTGSRNFGKKVCEHFDTIARNGHSKVDMSEYIKEINFQVSNGTIDKRDISRLLKEKKESHKVDFDIKTSSYVTGELLSKYMEGMFLAQVYAELNRELIMEKIEELLIKLIGKGGSFTDSIETVHNFISFRDNIIRKGAVASYSGERLIIPFNMRDGILICEGKSNADWNYSAPHGAGRVLSRSQAKEKVSMEDYKKSMEGIFTTSCNIDTLDESPMAYKDAEMIEKAIEPTAKVLFKLKPIYNVKAGGE